MEGFRSKSCRNVRKGPNGMQDLRSHSVSYANQFDKEPKIKKAKSSSNNNGYNNNSGSGSRNWSFNDPELQRKKRLACYKVYTMEGKMKGSLRKSFKWIKDTYNQVVRSTRKHGNF